MSGGLQEKIYNALPVWAQNLACTYYGRREARVRFSEEYRRRFDWLQKTQFWSRSEIENYQDEQIRDLIAYAYANIPFYRKRMDERKLAPADFKGRADLPKMPVLTKEDVRLHGSEMLSREFDPKTLVYMHTSGTTGKSLHFYKEREAISFQWALWQRHKGWFGCELGDTSVNFTGKLATPMNQNRPPYWRHNRTIDQYIVNMQHVVPAKAEAIAGFLASIQPKFYSGYPSILADMARLALDGGYILPDSAKPKFVFYGAENMLDWQRRMIVEWTGAKISDHYGLSEGCGNASRCSEDLYHEDFEFAYLECDEATLDETGAAHGRLICTGFASRAMPFIRYDAGDVAVWAPAEKRCSCERNSRAILSFDGRIDDYVVTPEGGRVMRFDYLFKDIPAIQDCQILQYELDAVIVKIVRRKDHSARDDEEVRRQVARWISPTLKVEIEHVTELEREPNGKLRAVKSYLNNTKPQ